MIPARLTALTIALGFSLATGAFAAGPEQVWVAEGISVPESALWDGERQVLYVSAIAGAPTDKNAAGHIALLSIDGDIIDANWVGGLHAPKGLSSDGERLYVPDIDRLIVIDIDSGEIVAIHVAAGAVFLNDSAIDDQGRVYVSDMATDSIYRLDESGFNLWLQDPGLEAPNGLRAEPDRLLVAAWGTMTDGFATEVPGHLKAVDYDSKAITSIGDGSPVGNLDGLEPAGEDGWLVTDWMNGGLWHISASGEATQLADLDQGSADHEVIEDQRLVVIPMMMNDKVVAYRVE